MEVPIFKAHGDNTDREYQGFYFAMPRTTYCFSEDTEKLLTMKKIAFLSGNMIATMKSLATTKIYTTQEH